MVGEDHLISANLGSTSKYILILIAAFIGVIPGCGGMIAVAVAYISIPDFPMAALIAALIGIISRSIIATIFSGLASYWFLIFVV